MATTMRRPFTVTEYERMGTSGIITAQERTELIDGEVITMSPIGPRHAQCVNRLTRLLSACVPDGAILSVQNPIRLSDRHEPQPDLVVQRDLNYTTTPTAADVLLLIEVSDTTLVYDQEVKMPLYAAAGIAEAWVVDLAAGDVERYTDPQDGACRHVARATYGESLASTALPVLTIAVDAILR